MAESCSYYLQGLSSPVITDEERLACAPPENISMQDWIEKYRYLDKLSSSEVGYKRLSRTPALRVIYDWFRDDYIREIVIQKPAQFGVTCAIVDIVVWVAKNDPSPMALYLADQETARKVMKLRIEPAIRRLGLTIKRGRAEQQEVTKFEITLPNGFYLMVSWGSSVSQTGSMSFKYVICDELNKPGYNVTKDEGAAVGRIKERVETFADSKIILLSTPTLDDGRITNELKNCDAVFDHACPCPHCGSLQRLHFPQVVWEGGSKASWAQIRKARYKCEHCGSLWSERQRKAAVSAGVPVCRTDVKRFQKVGYQLHRLCGLFSGGDMAAMVKRWIETENDVLERQNVINSVFGEPWVPVLSPKLDTRIGMVSSCKSGYSRGVVPDGTVALACAIDTQQNGFWWKIRGSLADGSTFGIDEGFAENFDDLDKVVFDTTYGGLPIWRAVIDTGGGRDQDKLISRTEEVYLWLRKNHRRGVQLYGTKGSSTPMATKIKAGAIIERTPSRKPLPGGVQIVIVNTEAVKDALWFRIEQTAMHPDVSEVGWFIHRDTPAWVIEQICAEEKRRKRKGGGTYWHRLRPNNHMLDLEVLLLVCFDPEFHGGLRPVLARKKRVAAAPAPENTTKPAARQYVPGQQSLTSSPDNPITSRRL